jgi:uncharacterized protein YsxB (DUF464 family)|tara:strand:- start:3296 stop:3694 length:399 start_codon:yes stop_codon:yes gene_type:complete
MSLTEEDELIINLKVLASLQPNKKLISKDTYLNIEVDTIIPQGLKRAWRGDSRDDVLKKIDLIVRRSIDIYKKNDILGTYLEKSITGLQNLKETYSSCVQTCSRIDTIIDKIKRNISVSQTILGSHSDSESE